MNCIKANLSSKENNSHQIILIDVNNVGFTTKDFNINVIERDSASFDIEISSENKEICEINKFFLEIYDFLFLNYGFYFKIDTYFENNEEIEFEKISNIDCYDTNCHFIISTYLNYLNNILNERNINNFIKLKKEHKYTINTFKYLLCNNYSKILIPHRLTILLQAIEGYNYNKGKNYKERLKKTIDIIQEYDTIFNSELELAFEVSFNDIIDLLTNTRHLYSHLNEEENNKSYLNNGTDMVILCDLLCFSYRAMLFKDLNINLENENIKEYLYSMHDWINGLNKKDLTKYKSKAYKLSKIFNN